MRYRTIHALPLLFIAAALTGTPGAAQTPAAPVDGLDSLLEIRVSTAAKYSQRVSEVAGSVTIITSDDIEHYGYQTLDQVLATVPGFYTSYDRNYSYIGTRGFGRAADYNNRLLLLVDGNVVNESVFGAALMGSELAIPLVALERIEIVRGPGSALYGTGAIFGVINLITRSAAAIDGGRVSVHGGNYGHHGAEGLFGHRFQSGVGLSLGGLWDRADGQDLFYPEYDSPATHGGVAHNLDGERRWGLLGGITRGDLRLHGRYGSRRKAIPTASYGMAFNAPGAYTWDSYGFLELDYGKDLDARRHLSTRAYYNHYKYNGDFPFADSLGAVSPTTEASINDVLGGEVALRWDLSPANRLTGGGEFRRNLEASFISPRDTPHDIDLNVPSTELSGYLQDEHQFSRGISLLAGLRYDVNSMTREVLTPRAGLLLRPYPRTTLKLLYGEAFRAPSVYEAGIVTPGVFARNPDLRPERARTFEVVLQEQLGAGLLWSTSVFRYRMRDLIDLTVDTTSGLYTYRNVAAARSSGLESGVDARFGPRASGFANYTWQRTVDDQTGERLSNSPAHLFRAGASMAVTPWFRTGLLLRYDSSRRTLAGGSTDPFFIADLNLSLGHPMGRTTRQLELGVRVNNLFDARYAMPGGAEHLQVGIPQDGRNVNVELRYGF